MRGMRGVGGGNNAASRKKKLPTRGRNVEGATYTVVDVGSERAVRCKGCEQIVPLVKWWEHRCPMASQG